MDPRQHGYPVPAGVAITEEVIRRSRFRTMLGPAATPDEAHAFVHDARVRFPDATHHCWAYLAGPPGETARVGMSDDGEPSGTAGRPMLTVLLHSGIGEVVAVCVRWYGGIQLGTGGLQRAYTSGVRRTLETLTVEERIALVRLEIVFTYPCVDPVQRLVEEVGGTLLDERYGAEVRYSLEIPEIRIPRFSRGFAELTGGVGRVNRLEGS
ncbi:MAG: YigZ family protein [Longimicrobiales bacterium]|nr:YigZ family protein [Longimicrobiales bacterium]